MKQKNGNIVVYDIAQKQLMVHVVGFQSRKCLKGTVLRTVSTNQRAHSQSTAIGRVTSVLFLGPFISIFGEEGITITI